MVHCCRCLNHYRPSLKDLWTSLYVFQENFLLGMWWKWKFLLKESEFWLRLPEEFFCSSPHGRYVLNWNENFIEVKTRSEYWRWKRVAFCEIVDRFLTTGGKGIAQQTLSATHRKLKMAKILLVTHTQSQARTHTKLLTQPGVLISTTIETFCEKTGGGVSPVHPLRRRYFERSILKFEEG